MSGTTTLSGRVASHTDLAVAAGYVVAVTAVLALVGDLPTAVAVPLALPVLLFAPGYAVVTAIAPATGHPASADGPGDRLGVRQSHDGLSRLERLTLSVVASVAVVPLVALVLDFVVGVALVPVLAGVAAVTVLAAVVAAHRRDSGGAHVAGAAGGPATGPSLLAGVPTDGITLGCATIAVLMLVGSATMAVTGDQAAETEFYLVTETADGEYEASGYTTDIADGETAEYTLGIEQHSAQPREYTVVAQLQERSGAGANATVEEREELDRFSTTVRPGNATIETSAVTPTTTGDRTLAFLLYEGEAPAEPDRESAHRVVHLPVEIT
ncbi:Uncharacterized membrane protein [Halomicrobium zhouii]|uniref:Uncharacterized membrane protein n=1 Tax=Halomicrobium zhouii TaxID=767519 RepID=A0A1I6K6E5_9EURY|nr:DUF1616 domain-containing protein [Halomicrobium zhouii]SFR86823.1 Uncharacterized membrane protein [Halomicrobium zhouii]